ncbi:MAG TPA: J domain-containing protein [Xanthobacteraceae bacterium]|nr:J domain-containing protein [Xanthobacteraceae bacterium]
MRDPYEVLGVKKNADAAAIKSAYRKLAKKLHPDANKNDPKAAQRFAEVNAAYEILGEEDKRKAFDRGEIDAEGKPKFRGFEGFGPKGDFGRDFGRGGADFNFEHFSFGPEGVRRSSGPGGFSNLDDLLSGVFGGFANAPRGRGRARGFAPEESGGRDVTAEVTISLAEAAKGGTRRVHLPTGKEVDVKVPAGLAEGKQIRLKGQGLPGPGGVGDVLITIRVAPHPYFVRDGDNLRVDVPITLYEAVLGGKVRVPTLNGAVELNVPAGTSSGRTFRISGKGMPAEGKAGDLYATVRIALPEKGDRDLEELMRKWRHDNPYDPRKDLK